jgi:hypothetical protein
MILHDFGFISKAAHMATCFPQGKAAHTNPKFILRSIGRGRIAPIIDKITLKCNAFVQPYAIVLRANAASNVLAGNASRFGSIGYVEVGKNGGGGCRVLTRNCFFGPMYVVEEVARWN